jgi:thiol-disulfide isomerase/thioredoxin
MAAHDLHRRRRALAGLGGAVLAAGWTAAARAQPAAEDRGGPPARPGTRLVLSEVPMLDGSVFRPESADGHVLVLYWWASWCPFCAVQSPLMDKLWQAQRGRGLRMLGLSIDKRPEDAIAYLQRRGYTFPSGFVTPAVARALPKPKGLPVTYVRGRDALLLMAEAGQLFPEDIEQIARFV